MNPELNEEHARTSVFNGVRASWGNKVCSIKAGYACFLRLVSSREQFWNSQKLFNVVDDCGKCVSNAHSVSQITFRQLTTWLICLLCVCLITQDEDIIL